MAAAVPQQHGNGTFTDISGRPASPIRRQGSRRSVCDYDRDGQTDIYVANDTCAIPLPQYRQRHLRRRGLSRGVGFDLTASRELAGHGLRRRRRKRMPDLFVTNFSEELNGPLPEPGGGIFEEVTTQAGNRLRFSSGIRDEMFDATRRRSRHPRDQRSVIDNVKLYRHADLRPEGSAL